MQILATYGDLSANILIDHQPWGTDNVTVRLTDYDVIRAAQKEPQTLKVTDHLKWFCHKRLTNDDGWVIIRRKRSKKDG